MSVTDVLSPSCSQFIHAPILRFRIQEPEAQPRVVEMPGHRLRVGSLAENDLVVADRSVSGIHFELTVDHIGCRLHDVGSTNGTFVDAYRVGSVYLRSGSVIAIGRSRMEVEISASMSEIPLSPRDHFGPMVGASEPMREMFAALEKVAPTDFTVLIEGETGTGKELVAEGIHRASARAGGPLVVFDCSAVAPTLLESMLFGHDKGAFTGAAHQQIGCLEEADGGTLFLDELGELPLDLQAKLLRALENGEFRRVGGSKALRSNVRVLAATNRDLAREVNQGSFRADLYYRVAVVRVVVPPLRERIGDLDLLVRHFAHSAFNGNASKVETFVASLSKEEWLGMRRHTWPGNVRELRNAIQRRSAMGRDLLGPASANVSPAAAKDQPPPEAGELRVSFNVDLDLPFLEQRKAIVAEFDQAYLVAQLERHGGVVARAARTAEIDRMYYRRLLKKNQ